MAPPAASDPVADGAVTSTLPPVEKASLWEDFVDIFYAPSLVFERRRNGKFGYALLFLTLAGVTLHFLTRNAMQPVMDAEFAFRSAEMVRANPEVTSEQMAAGRKFFETFAPVIFALTFPLAVILTGIVLWAVSKLFDAKEPLVAALMISTYSQVPRLVQMLTTAAQGLFMAPESITSAHSVSFSLARFMDPTTANSVLLVLASRLDVFTIWVTVLLAIGLHVVARIPRQSAALAAAITWFVGALPGIIGALRAG
jgi:hypothetical protein